MDNGVYVFGKLNEVTARYSEKTQKTYVTAFLETSYSLTQGSKVEQISMEVPETTIAEVFKDELLKHRGKDLMVQCRTSVNTYGSSPSVSFYAGVVAGQVPTSKAKAD